MPKGGTYEASTLAMALVGYELEKQKIEDRIRQIKAQLGHGRVKGGAAVAAKSAGPSKRRPLSAAARRRIAAAQRKRWAEHRKKLGQAGKRG